MATTICPACKLPLEIPPPMAGQPVSCPRCRTTFSSPVPSMVPLPGPTPVVAPSPPVSSSETSTAALRERPITLLDVFDLSFKRYVTPLIVKVTWVLTLFFASIWLLIIFTVLMIDLMPDTPAHMRQRPGLQFDLIGVLNKIDRAWWRTLIRTVMVSTQVATVVLFVLWMRVLLESVMVVFQMAASLKSIDRKTKTT